jgi:hypothetical protein
MTNERVPAIFEGAFEFDGVRVRVDGLERLANGAWGLREAKSSAGPKDYFGDIALQLYVLKRAGIVVSSAEHSDVDTAHVRGPVGPRAHSILLAPPPTARGRFAPHAVEAALRPSAACAAARRAIGIRNGEHET